MLLLLALACSTELHETSALSTALAQQGIDTWDPDDTPFDWIPTVDAFERYPAISRKPQPHHR